MTTDLNARILDTLPLTIAVVDSDGVITHVNETWRKFALENGRPPNSSDIGRNYLEICLSLENGADDDAKKLYAGIQDVLLSRIPMFRLEYPCHSPGTERWFSATVTRLHDGSTPAVVVAHTDITERKRAELEVRKYKSIVESTDDAVISKSLEGIIESWNHGGEIVFGYKAAETIGRSINMLIPNSHLDEELNLLERVCRNESIDQYETVRLHKSGQLIDISLTICPILDDKGTVVGASKIARDITERKRLEKMLQDMARTDPLTGLANRRSAAEAIEAEFLRSRRFGTDSALLMIDIDHFKQVNDIHGHEAGDQALVALAKALKAIARSTDLSARFGGEEFVVLSVGSTLLGAMDLAERIREAVAGIVVTCPPSDFGFTVSIGVAAFLNEDANWLEALSRADKAMYQAKKAGRNRAIAASAGL